MNPSQREDFKGLDLQYTDPTSLMYKKIHIIDNLVGGGDKLLDIGAGTGEWIDLVKDKFKIIYGIDVDADSIDICRRKFIDRPNIRIMQCDMENINSKVHELDFNCITCLDVLEHIPRRNVDRLLATLYNMMAKRGKLIFTGPIFFEKVRIAAGKSPTHLHSHSSYGWGGIIERAGFEVVKMESVEFPLIDREVFRKNLHIFGKCCVITAEKR
jgi:2-polyprenyl-3-methyl-5-hydroxy-6-metoxy-1,4-benzoquinol methylase